MTVLDELAKWDLSQSHEGRCRVDVYSAGELVAEGAEIVDGTITEQLALGLRADLSLTVEPSTEWLSWLQLPRLELRVWSGISWGLSEHLEPMGVFVIDKPKRTLPVSLLELAGADRWSIIANNDLLYRWPGPGGLASELAARLIREGGLQDVSVEVDRDMLAPARRWEGRRQQLISDYLLPIDATAYCDREGRALIRTNKTEPGRPLTHGQNGTLITITEEPSLDGVFNAVGAESSNTDVVFDEPVFVMITDQMHPAHEDKIYRRQTLVSSNLIHNRSDAVAFAWSELARLSRGALGWSAECVPDPTRRPGQLVPVTSQLGAVSAVIQQVRHPLVVGGAAKSQSITFGATL